MHTLSLTKGVCMWEFEVICDAGKRDIIEYIQQELKPLINQYSGVMATANGGERAFLSIGAKINHMPVIKAKLRLAICDVICQNIKQDFLQNNLDLPDNQPQMTSAFLKVCTYFDRELERQIVLRTLELNTKRLDITSFVRFRLNNLIKKWQELCTLANQNAITILRKENFVELLKFLLQSIDSKCQSVILELNDKCIIYHDTKNDFDIISTIKENTEFEILSKLVELNPYLIKVHSGENDEEIVRLVRLVFEDRVEIG